MTKLNIKMLAAAAVTAALLAGCGGGGGGGGGVAGGGGVGGGGGVTPGQPQTITADSVVDFINRLFANSENSEPIDANLITLATDDTREAQALP